MWNLWHSGKVFYKLKDFFLSTLLSQNNVDYKNRLSYIDSNILNDNKNIPYRYYLLGGRTVWPLWQDVPLLDLRRIPDLHKGLDSERLEIYISQRESKIRWKPKIQRNGPGIYICHRLFGTTGGIKKPLRTCLDLDLAMAMEKEKRRALTFGKSQHVVFVFRFLQSKRHWKSEWKADCTRRANKDEWAGNLDWVPRHLGILNTHLNLNPAEAHHLPTERRQVNKQPDCWQLNCILIWKTFLTGQRWPGAGFSGLIYLGNWVFVRSSLIAFKSVHE